MWPLTDVGRQSVVDPDLDVEPTQNETRRSARPRCAQCGEVIGTYEPLILASDDGFRKTSQASEPHLLPTTEACYHLACSPAGVP
jgi:hypothetical protein